MDKYDEQAREIVDTDFGDLDPTTRAHMRELMASYARRAAEEMRERCLQAIPGGSIVDPQSVADILRSLPLSPEPSDAT